MPCLPEHKRVFTMQLFEEKLQIINQHDDEKADFIKVAAV